MISGQRRRKHSFLSSALSTQPCTVSAVAQGAEDIVIKSVKGVAQESTAMDEASASAFVVSDVESTRAASPMPFERLVKPLDAGMATDNSQTSLTATNAEEASLQHQKMEHQITATLQIDAVVSQANALNVSGFKGSNKDKDFLQMDEKLTCFMLQLDAIECHANEADKRARKSAICHVQQLCNLLQATASGDS
jgi:hypothetical protein